MFDINVISKRIKNARVQKNMTQMDLADAMGVSYQAVSNWERGNSLPDISKIEQLCKELDISFDVLLGSDSKEAVAVKKAINDVDSLSTEEVSRIAPMIKPIDLKNTIKKDKANLDIDVLVNLAVFLDEEEITEMAKRVDSISDISKLVGLAPFVNEKILCDLAMQYKGNWGDSLTGLAPFLDKEMVGTIAVDALENGNIDIEHLKSAAPFIDGQSIERILEYIKEKGNIEDLLAFAVFK